jgi:hypothetical protein
MPKLSRNLRPTAVPSQAAASDRGSRFARSVISVFRERVTRCWFATTSRSQRVRRDSFGCEVAVIRPRQAAIAAAADVSARQDLEA